MTAQDKLDSLSLKRQVTKGALCINFLIFEQP